MLRIFCLNLIMLLMLGTGAWAREAAEPIKIAILPCTDIVMTFKKFHPLAAYLTRKTGLAIKLVVPEDATKFETAIVNGELDFALQDPHTFLKLANLFDREFLLRARNSEGGTTQRAVVIVRQDRGLTKVADLKGKTVMFGPKFSSSKWIAARALFAANGIDIDQDLKAYFNGGCCEDIAFNVYLKAVDAGVVCNHFTGDHAGKHKELGIDTSQIVVIGRTKTVPMKVFGARKGIDKETGQKIVQALLNLDKKNPEHGKILSQAELGGFEKYHDEDYDPLKKMMQLNGSGK